MPTTLKNQSGQAYKYKQITGVWHRAQGSGCKEIGDVPY